MTEQLIKPKSLGGFVRSLSGLFMTKENPLGLTPKECTVVAVLLSVVGNEEITKEHRIEVSNQLNQSLQVTTNYISKFKKKKVVTEQNRLHIIFFTKITIDGTDIL
jgi:hypothetical protein